MTYRTEQDKINRKEANRRYYKLEENKQQKRDYMKTFNELMEAIKKWSDVTDKKLKKNASDFLKALDRGQVLGYSIAHDEFSIFDTEKDFIKAQKEKNMKWIVVEGKTHYEKLLKDIK